MTDHVHISRLREHPHNIRADLGDLTELAESIAAQGILQPLVVQPHPGDPGAYEVIAGHRRLAAAKLTRVQQIPITVRRLAEPGPAASAGALEMMLVENIQRKDLGPVEKAEAMGALRNHGRTAAQIARRTGLSDATVGYYLSLLELDDDARKRVRDGHIPVGEAIAAVRRVRARQRQRRGAPRQGAVWEPDHLDARHPLARKADATQTKTEVTMTEHLDALRDAIVAGDSAAIGAVIGDMLAARVSPDVAAEIAAAAAENAWAVRDLAPARPGPALTGISGPGKAAPRAVIHDAITVDPEPVTRSSADLHTGQAEFWLDRLAGTCPDPGTTAIVHALLAIVTAIGAAAERQADDADTLGALLDDRLTSIEATIDAATTAPAPLRRRMTARLRKPEEQDR